MSHAIWKGNLAAFTAVDLIVENLIWESCIRRATQQPGIWKLSQYYERMNVSSELQISENAKMDIFSNYSSIRLED